MKISTNFVAVLATLVIFFSGIANARDARTKKPKTVVDPAPSADTSLRDRGYTGATDRSILALSGPVTFIDGNAYWGVYGDYLRELAPNLFVGGETGFQYRSVTGGSAWVVPVLLTGLHYCDRSPIEGVTPFLGASLGVGIVHTSIDGLNASIPGVGNVTSSGVSDTSVKFEGFAHLGAAFGMSRNFFADLRIGTASSSFLIAPTVGYYF